MLESAIPQISRAIGIGQLQTDLAVAVAFEESDPSRSARRQLQDNNFDQAPVVQGGVPVGYVLRSELERGRGSVGAYVRPILPSALVSAQCPLEDALPWLEVTRFLFVLTDRSISGFVVPSDLNRQAGRAYFSLSVVALELELAEIVRHLNTQIDVLSLLPHQAAGSVRSRLRKNTDANVEADVVAEMTFSQLLHVVGSGPTILERLGFDCYENWRAAYLPIRNLRNRLAHPAQPLLGSYDDLPWLVAVGRQTQELLARATQIAAAEKDLLDS
jgi:hypothetical protein